jgi:benzoyl-CoA 2,3-dioxygenase component A
VTALVRQHLIDPEVCIRCNTCEETCPNDAITHDKHNYVVKFEACIGCGDCLPPCPTGAIDNWRHVEKPYSTKEQFQWDSLPVPTEPPRPVQASPEVPTDVAQLTARATAASGQLTPPWSAAHPYVGLYSPERPAVATVSGNLRLTEEGADSDIRHLVLDFGSQAFPVLEGQSIGIIPPGADLRGKPHHVRLYSVASPRDGERPKHNNLALTVKRVTVDHDGQPVRGLASNYLCDLKRGDKVRVTGPYGHSFLMPNHPGAKLLMICTGTGAAPMRAMTERRRRRLERKEGGDILLFFGARQPGELPYFGPLQKLPRELIQVELAFSRVPGQPKEYVQQRMRARPELICEWLQHPETFIFVCGHKRMERDVLKTLEDLCRERGLDWEMLAQTLRQQGRLHLETY